MAELECENNELKNEVTQLKEQMAMMLEKIEVLERKTQIRTLQAKNNWSQLSIDLVLHHKQ